MIERNRYRRDVGRGPRDGETAAVAKGRDEGPDDAGRARDTGWLRYGAARYGNGTCARCGAALEVGTAYLHCAPCLATRGIDERALRGACARAMEGDWPFIAGPPDGLRWARALIAFWRDHVDPMESRAVPYRTGTLESAFYFMQRHLSETRVAAVWTAPAEREIRLDPAMVVRAAGEALAIGVGAQRRIATAVSVPSVSRDPRDPRAARDRPLALFDAFLGLAGEEVGFLVVEKLSRRARRDAPVVEQVSTTAGGHRVTQLRCLQEDRTWLAPSAQD